MSDDSRFLPQECFPLSMLFPLSKLVLLTIQQHTYNFHNNTPKSHLIRWEQQVGCLRAARLAAPGRCSQLDRWHCSGLIRAHVCN